MNFLPGWQHGLLALTPPGPTVTFVASTTSVTNTITAPPAINAGDLLVIAHCGSDSDAAAPVDVTPTGFTLAVTDSVDDPDFSNRLSIHYKVATGAEDSGVFSVIAGNDSFLATDQRSIFAVFRRTPAASTWSLNDGQPGGGGSDTITSGTGDVPLVAIAASQDNLDGESGDPADFTFTPTQDAIIANGGDNAENLLTLTYKIYNVSPADLTVNAGFYGRGSAYFEGVA